MPGTFAQEELSHEDYVQLMTEMEAEIHAEMFGSAEYYDSQQRIEEVCMVLKLSLRSIGSVNRAHNSLVKNTCIH